jgi:hypothetical protein
MRPSLLYMTSRTDAYKQSQANKVKNQSQQPKDTMKS